jgi:type I restriction enzyme S subunit
VKTGQVQFDGPAVILSSIGARCGKCFYADGKWSSLANTQIIRPDPEKGDYKYLWYQLNDESRWPRSGTGQPFIKPSDVKRHLVFLPPLSEQRRIAAILDKADTLRTKRREALAQLDRLAQSIFVEMFGDPLTNSKGWPEGTSLGEVADIVSGVTKGRKLNGKTTREVPYLAVANVQEMRLNLTAVKRIDATEEEINRYALRDGDLLLTEGGDPDKLGRGTLWHGELPECIHQNHVFRVRLIADSITPYFLNWLVGSQRGKQYFLKSAKQTTGIASINMTQLRGFPLLLPPVSLQREFEGAIGAIQRHTVRLSAATYSCNALFATLQNRAFRGEL